MNKVTEGIGHDGTPRFSTRASIDGKQRMFTERSRRQLVDAIKAARLAAAQGKEPPSKEHLGPFMERWLAAGTGSKSAATNQSYRELYNMYIKKPLGDYRISDLKLAVLQPWVDGLATIDRKHRCRRMLRACLQTAVDWELLTRNPCDNLKLPPKPEPDRRRWNMDQAWAFWDVARSHAYGAYFALALSWPARPGEVLGMRWGNVDLATRTVKVAESRSTFDNRTVVGRTKTPNSRRTVKLSAETAEYL